jgi:hypothetical protein
MVGIIKTIFVLCCILISLAISGWAGQSRHASVHAAAMGNALMASDLEPAAVFTNPAAMAAAPSFKLASFFSKPYIGLPGITSLWSGDLAALVPLPYGCLGAGYSFFQADALLQEQTGVMAYSAGLWQTLEMGAAIEYLWHGYLIGDDPLAAVDPVFRNGTAKGAVAFDLGLRYTLWRHLVLGLAARNINQPDWGLVSEDKVPLEMQAGFAFTWKGLTAMADVLWKNSAAGQAEEPLLPAVGLEGNWWGDTLLVRLGVNPLEATAGCGWRSFYMNGKICHWK